MVGGIEKYYQICRCYRDEDFRADRQPEFTQLDIEMAFTVPDDIIELTEQVVKAVFAVKGINVKIPIKRMTYKDAMDRFGSDKPDLRFELELKTLTPIFDKTNFKVFQNQEYVGAVIYPNGATQPRRTLDKWQDWAKTRGAKGLAYILIDENGEYKGPVAKNLSSDELKNIKEKTNAKKNDCIFFVAGKKSESQSLLGAVRIEIAKRLNLIDNNDFKFTWVVDAPLFKPTNTDDDVAVGGKDSKWTAVHHAFTMPKDEYLDTFDKDPANTLSNAYDIVCNGNEIGGGSMRIHIPSVQKRVFDVMGLTDNEIESKFGWFLRAYDYGAPPHGGIALGWDRIAAIITKSESIRDVIAFPKTGNGFDPLTGAPTEITIEQRREANIDFKPKKPNEN
jgi:aspartyl-tRNA synthetase